MCELCEKSKVKDWTIKQDDSNRDLFGDIERRELLLQKLKLLDKKADAYFEKMERGKARTILFEMQRHINEGKLLNDRIFSALKSDHGLNKSENEYDFTYKPERSILLITEFLEEENE